MIWPLLLVIAGLVMALFGLASAFGNPFTSRSRLSDASILLFPLGAMLAFAGLVWAIVLFIVGCFT